MKTLHLLLISTLLLLQGCTKAEAISSKERTVVTCSDTNYPVTNRYSSLDSDINWKSSPDYIIITSKTQTVYIPRYKCDLIIFR